MSTEAPSNVVSSHLRIVVGLGFTDADGPAFDLAVHLAQRVRRAEIHLVHVFDKELGGARARDLVAHLRLYVNEKAAIMSGLGGIQLGIHLRAGTTVREILRLASDVHADLVVVGSHRGPHLSHWVVGSTAEELVARAGCPVLVAPPRPRAPAHEEPTVEPPCPDCVRARTASEGAQWWCDRHAHRVAESHVYSYQRELPFAFHDSEVIPTGVDG